jgi:regulator of ribonuclease activity A
MSTASTDVSDAHPDALVLAPIFRDFGGRRAFSGRALTVRCFEDNSRIKELSTTAGEGRVLVVDGGGSLRCALLGDMIGKALADHGWAGVILAGCVRDTAALATLALGVKALAPHPRRSSKRGEGEVGVPVEVGGVRVLSGDLVHADEDGVVILGA